MAQIEEYIVQTVRGWESQQAATTAARTAEATAEADMSTVTVT